MVGDGTYLSVGEVRDLLGGGIAHSTVQRMFDDDEGPLDGFVTEIGGHRRISAVSVAKVLLLRPESAHRDGALELLRQSGVDIDKVRRELEQSQDA